MIVAAPKQQAVDLERVQVPAPEVPGQVVDGEHGGHRRAQGGDRGHPADPVAEVAC
jgi:hypothetical protein